MSTYDISATRARIKALLQTVTELSYVYDSYESNISGYPCAIMEMSNETGNPMDDSNNYREITFTIRILQEVKIATYDVSIGILDSAVKAVVNILEKKTNDTLSGTVDWVMPVSGQRNQTTTPSGLLIYQDIILRCYVASNIL